MLLVTFHGGSTGVTNVYAFDTGTGQLLTDQALQGAPLSGAELRGMVSANSLLYVVNGAKQTSTILCFQPRGTVSRLTRSISSAISSAPTLSKKGHFENSIGHPYALQFSGPLCYVSNQDTNVVAQASVAPDFRTATIEQGCQSAYLNNETSFCPSSGCVYLDGTFVASRNGTLPDVAVVATDVPSKFGGLAVHISDGEEGLAAAAAKGKPKVQNSVRDLAIAGNVLLVCDEPKQKIRLYALTDGTYLAQVRRCPQAPPTWRSMLAGFMSVREISSTGPSWAIAGPRLAQFPERPDLPLGFQGGRYRHRRGDEYGLRGLPGRHRNDRQRPDQRLPTGPANRPCRATGLRHRHDVRDPLGGHAGVPAVLAGSLSPEFRAHDNTSRRRPDARSARAVPGRLGAVEAVREDCGEATDERFGEAGAVRSGDGVDLHAPRGHPVPAHQRVAPTEQRPRPRADQDDLARIGSGRVPLDRPVMGLDQPLQPVGQLRDAEGALDVQPGRPIRGTAKPGGQGTRRRPGLADQAIVQAAIARP